MASPAPYSKPRRGKENNKVVAFTTEKGSRVYAPNGGTLRKVGSDLTVTTSKGVVHKITGAVPRRKWVNKKVAAGAWVGNASGKVIRYSRFTKSGTQVDAMTVATRKNNKKSGTWMPGVKRKPNSGGGDMSSGGGSECKVVWHTTESGNAKGAIDGVANYVTQRRSAYHLLWNPRTGEIVQMYPSNIAARSLLNARNIATNRHGKVCIQISIVGKASDRPLKKGRNLLGRRKLMEWFDGHGVPRTNITSSSRSVSQFTKSGHTNHRSAPGNDHTDLYMAKEDWAWLLRP